MVGAMNTEDMRVALVKSYFAPNNLSNALAIEDMLYRVIPGLLSGTAAAATKAKG
jgi:hypothetical protein